MTGTPGQAAYEALRSGLFPQYLGDDEAVSWDELEPDECDGFEQLAAVVAAAIAAAPQPAPELDTRLGYVSRMHRALKALDELFKIDSDLRNPWNARALKIVLRGLGRGDTADEELAAALGPDPQPAPGLAAAITETRALRALIGEILSHFSPSGSGHTARVGQVQIARWLKRAGLTP